MPCDREHGLLDRDRREPEAVLAAGEDVAQGVVDVDSLRVEHGVAVLDDVDVEEHRVARAERLRADMHVVAGRAGEDGLQDAARDDVPRGDEHDEQHRRRRGDDHHATRRSHAKHRFLRPRPSTMTNQRDAPAPRRKPENFPRLYKSRLRTVRACSWMKSLRGSTLSPISVVNIRSASSEASSSVTRLSRRDCGSIVVSASCSASISPRPLNCWTVNSLGSAPSKIPLSSASVNAHHCFFPLRTPYSGGCAMYT